MKRKQFVNEVIEHMRRQRRKKFPDIRMSEEAMASLDDRKSALKFWRQLNAADREKLIERSSNHVTRRDDRP
jgi:hypothetical protein